MLTIRNNVFETNSSSTHGIAIEVYGAFYQRIECDYNVNLENDTLTINGYDFSRFDFCICSVEEKISLCLMLLMIFKIDTIEFIDFIKQKTGAKNVINNIKFMENAFITTEIINDTFRLDSRIRKGISKDNDNDDDDYDCATLADILDDYKVLEIFIFGKNVQLTVGDISC